MSIIFNTHRLKTLQPFFRDIKQGKKSFELRLKDRDYQIGDTVILEEWTGFDYTGEKIAKKIIYILNACPQFGLMDGYCILGLLDLEVQP